MAEGVGFEPTEVSLNGFQDRRLQPLGHPSTMFDSTINRPGRQVPIWHCGDLNRRIYSGLAYFFKPAHIRPQHIRDNNGAVGLLVIFQHRHEGSPDRKSRAIECMNKVDFFRV